MSDVDIYQLFMTDLGQISADNRIIKLLSKNMHDLDSQHAPFSASIHFQYTQVGQVVYSVNLNT